MHPRLLTFLVCIVPALSTAADYYIDNTTGADSNAGTQTAPFATLKKALSTAGPGDTVHLNPTEKPYRQSADFYGHDGGQPDRPLILDGHGATLTGADPCPPEGWKPKDNGVFFRDDMVSVTFLLVDGKMVLHHPTIAYNNIQPGEFTWHSSNRLYFHPPENKSAPDFKIAVEYEDGTRVDLNPRSWQRTHSTIQNVRRYPGLRQVPVRVFIDEKPAPLLTDQLRIERLQPGQWVVLSDGLYFKPPATKSLTDLQIECITRANGVQFGGKTAHVTIRNLIATHVYNDGYNIHGDTRDIRFENIEAHHCGDEGFSSHDTCETELDGGIFTYCDNGIFNVNQCRAITRNVICAFNRSVGFGATHDTRQTIANLILLDNPSQLTVGLNDNIEADNLLIIKASQADFSSQALNLGGQAHFKRTTILGHKRLMSIQPSAKVTIEQSHLGPDQDSIHIQSANPEELLQTKNVTAHSSISIQFGTRTSWKTRPLKDWPGITLMDSTDQSPKSGCTESLLKRFTEFQKKPK